MRVTYLAICVCFVAVAVLVTNAVSSDRLDHNQLAERIVGQETPPSNIPPDKCCKKAMHTDCNRIVVAACSVQPYCPQSQVEPDQCVNPSCLNSSVSGSVCTTPAAQNTFRYSGCELDGQKINGSCPVNQKRCGFINIEYDITYTNCNYGNSLCGEQFADPCE